LQELWMLGNRKFAMFGNGLPRHAVL
jgi:hypothetical protein